MTRPRPLIRRSDAGLEKRCVKCGEWWPLESCYSLDRRGALGRDNRCRACRSEARVLRARLCRPLRTTPILDGLGRLHDERGRYIAAAQAGC